MSRSKFGVAAVAVSSVFLLSGCLSLEMDLNIQSDGLASGDVTIGLEEETASSFGFDSSEAFTEYFVEEQIGETGLESEEGGIDPDSCRPADVSGSVAVTCTFTDLEFPEAEAEETGWWVSTTEDTVTLFFENAEAESSDDPVAGAIEGSMLGSSEITLNVTMPGNITSVEGDAVEQTSDTTVIIQTPSTSAATATVVSERYPSEGGGVPVVLFGVAGALVVGGAAAFYFSRRAAGGGDVSAPQAAAGGWVPTQEPPMSEPPSGPRREPGSTWEY